MLLTKDELKSIIRRYEVGEKDDLLRGMKELYEQAFGSK
jgi:hypothetical protein